MYSVWSWSSSLRPVLMSPSMSTDASPTRLGMTFPALPIHGALIVHPGIVLQVAKVLSCRYSSLNREGRGRCAGVRSTTREKKNALMWRDVPDDGWPRVAASVACRTRTVSFSPSVCRLLGRMYAISMFVSRFIGSIMERAYRDRGSEAGSHCISCG